MKTITPKNAFKLILFLLILCSAKAISHPKLPNGNCSGESGSRIGCVNTMQAKSNALKNVKAKAALKSENGK